MNRNYQAIKTLPHEISSEFVHISFTNDSELFATIGDNGSHINIFESYNLTQVLKLFCSGLFVKKFEFSNNGENLFVISTDCRLRVYGIKNDFDEMQMEVFFLYDLPFVHRDSFNSFGISQNLIHFITGGKDPFLKLWSLNSTEIGKINFFLFFQ